MSSIKGLLYCIINYLQSNYDWDGCYLPIVNHNNKDTICLNCDDAGAVKVVNIINIANRVGLPICDICNKVLYFWCIENEEKFRDILDNIDKKDIPLVTLQLAIALEVRVNFYPDSIEIRRCTKMLYEKLKIDRTLVELLI